MREGTVLVVVVCVAHVRSSTVHVEVVEAGGGRHVVESRVMVVVVWVVLGVGGEMGVSHVLILISHQWHWPTMYNK